MTPEELTRSLPPQARAGRAAQFARGSTSAWPPAASRRRATRCKTALDAEVKRRGLAERCQVKGVGCLGLCSAGPLVAVDPERRDALPARHARRRRRDRRTAWTAVPVERLRRRTDQPFFTRQRRDRAGERRRDRSGADRGRTSPPAATRRCITVLARDDARRRSIERDHAQRAARPRRGRLPDRPEVGDRRQEPAASASTSSATPTRATPAPSWTAACWRATRTACWKGMAIAAYAVGASQGYIYVRGEYPLAIQRLQTAIRQARAARPARAADLRHAVRLPRRHPASAPAPSSAARRRR